MQGGGLAIWGDATLNSCQIYQNEASFYVVLAFRTFWTFLPSPRWNVTQELASCILLHAGWWGLHPLWRFCDFGLL